MVVWRAGVIEGKWPLRRASGTHVREAAVRMRQRQLLGVVCSRMMIAVVVRRLRLLVIRLRLRVLHMLMQVRRGRLAAPILHHFEHLRAVRFLVFHSPLANLRVIPLAILDE